MLSYLKQPCYPVFAEIIRSRWAALSIAALGALQLATSLVHIQSPCPMHATTGIPCPGCGLTRSVRALLHGQIGESLAWHPLGPLLLVGLVLALTSAVLPEARRNRFLTVLGEVESHSRGAFVLFIALMVIWILRVANASPLYHI